MRTMRRGHYPPFQQATLWLLRAGALIIGAA
jgi:hypothetical protein